MGAKPGLSPPATCAVIGGTLGGILGLFAGNLAAAFWSALLGLIFGGIYEAAVDSGGGRVPTYERLPAFDDGDT